MHEIFIVWAIKKLKDPSVINCFVSRLIRLKETNLIYPRSIATSFRCIMVDDWNKEFRCEKVL